MTSVAVIGAGAIGGVLAAAVAARGHAVSVCVRTPFSELIVLDPEGRERSVDARVLTDPDEAGPADWVLLCTKVHDTTSAAGWLAALTAGAEPSTVVVAQNGIDHESRARGLVAPGTRVVPASVVIAAEALAPGRVVHHGYSTLMVPAAAAAGGVGALFGDAINVVGVEDFVSVTWRKLMNNTIANPVTALTGRRYEVLNDGAVSELVDALGHEVLAVARAEGADLTVSDLDDLRAHYAGTRPDTGTSMLYDRLAGRPLEFEYLTGALVAAARRHDVFVPHHETVLALLRALQ